MVRSHFYQFVGRSHFYQFVGNFSHVLIFAHKRLPGGNDQEVAVAGVVRKWIKGLWDEGVTNTLYGMTLTEDPLLKLLQTSHNTIEHKRVGASNSNMQSEAIYKAK